MMSNRIRFTGMASGLDTDSIIKDLMKPHQFKIDKEKKAQALIQLRQEAWKDMNKKLYDFHTKYVHKMSMSSSFSSSIATSSNENAISISEETSVPLGTHRFEVKQLATSTSASGKIGNGIDSKTQLKDAMEGLDWEDGKATVTIKVNDKDVTFDVKEDDTLSRLATKMTDAIKGEGFRARYDAANNMFFINSTKSGKGQTISFADDNSGLFDKLGLTEVDAYKEGTDAKYKYNGVDLTSSSNNIEVNGMKATLKSITTEEVLVSSEADVDATYNFVKEFVTEYNKLILEINEKLDTRPTMDLEPLTAEEKKAMSESDIKLWEDKLNASLFYKDPQLQKFVDTSRGILGQVLDGDGDYNSLNSLGIVTGDWREKGVLHIEGDEDSDPLYATRPNKLKEAIAEKPDEVIAVLRNLGEKLYDANRETLKSNELKSALNFYNDKAMDKEIKMKEKQISKLEERMYKMEEMHYAKFAAMEKMLQQLNSQGSWLAQQFGG